MTAADASEIRYPAAEMLKTLNGKVLEARRVGVVESLLSACLGRIAGGFFGLEPFPDVFSKAAGLFHSIIVFHPFADGNKRTAVLALQLFLAMNGYEFRIPDDCVETAVKIAKLEIQDMESIKKWVRKNSNRQL